MSKLMDRLLFKITESMPCRVIADEEGPYLERYWVGERWGRTFYLHRFLASDPGDEMHNHPWAASCSLRLSGGYREERLTPDGPMITQKGLLSFLDTKTYHRVIIEPGTHCWTLFWHTSEVVQKWGFLQHDGTFREHTYEREIDRAVLGSAHKWHERALDGLVRRGMSEAWPFPDAPFRVSMAAWCRQWRRLHRIGKWAV